MNNSWYLLNEAKIRNEEISQQIKQNRLKRKSSNKNLELYDKTRKLLYRFGGLLIHSGTFLQKKYGDYCQIYESKATFIQKGL